MQNPTLVLNSVGFVLSENAEHCHVIMTLSHDLQGQSFKKIAKENKQEKPTLSVSSPLD